MSKTLSLRLLPVKLNIQLTRGTDNTIQVAFQNPATSVPYDITDDTIRWTAREGFTGPQLFKIENGPGEHSDPTTGVTQLTVSKAEIADIANQGVEKEFDYEIRRITGDGSEVVFFEGKLTLEPTPRADP